ncbi:MAG: ankyrin repeat domain-containing protein [Candidatus Accumulibacter sp.]|jgi:ankyrin repeat protein|nr:ankyrin repeat domain-containing protein [Accumulibacter sp.]
MPRKTLLAALSACLFLLCAPALGAMADDEFIALCADAPAERVKAALDAGANLEARDAQGAGALTWAASAGRLETAALLLARGVKIDAADDFGFTALMHSVASAPEIVAFLIERGADANARSKTGLTPLMLAVNSTSAKPEIIARLIAAGANVNAADDDGFTPLIFAAFAAGPEVVSMLLDAGADARARERLHGKSVADYARENKALESRPALARLLEKAGAPAKPAPAAPPNPPLPPLLGGNR